MERPLKYLSYVLFSLAFLVSCREATPTYDRWTGQTMGTFVEWQADVAAEAVQPGVDSVLQLINAVASTYIPSSTISRFNAADSQLCIDETSHAVHFERLMKLSSTVHAASSGYFDPTLMPLIRYWGFGRKKRKADFQMDQKVIDSLLQFVGFDKVNMLTRGNVSCLVKSQPACQLDFSAVAKGYGVDLVASYLRANGATNYYVNIGGEVVVSGANPKGTAWTLGINLPDTAAALDDIVGVIKLNAGGMASSGNYRQFYSDENGYTAHTINPKSGLASPSDLLSATVVAADCATADAFATAAMAMGAAKAQKMVEQASAIDALLIYKAKDSDALTYFMSPALKEKITITE